MLTQFARQGQQAALSWSGVCVPLLDAASSIARSLGETSTSYSSQIFDATAISNASQCQAARHMSGKGKGGPRGPPGRTPAAPVVAPTPVMKREAEAKQGVPLSAVFRKQLKEERKAVPPLELINEEQRQLAKELKPLPPPPKGGEAAAAAPPPPAELAGLKDVGLPLGPSDVMDLVHQSLSGALGQTVQFRPYLFSNIFQSAPVVAAYVAAAMEAGYQWSRVERFFLSSVEADTMVRGIKVVVKGRLGRKAGKASLKEWQYGDMDTSRIADYVDYGHAGALTRMGMLGIKVWVRYHDDAIPEGALGRPAPSNLASISLEQMTRVSRAPLPGRSQTAWWNTPGPLQPLSQRAWEALEPGYDPASPGGVAQYLAQFQPKTMGLQERIAVVRQQELQAKKKQQQQLLAQPKQQ